ncbi:MAG: aldo/keto reductase [Chloroflexi bacterium]|jgi:aryl-alcohol dehydrogenase-like predicted oxidoreductase|nr:aldo/keto reductase [Chloroflexota bacterium]
MNYVPLGHTGLKVSRVILGCGNFGGIGSAPAFFGKGENEAQAHAIMDAAWEMGITVFDTADAYGGGASETYIGNWLRGKGQRVRDQIILSSKVFNPVGDGPNDRGLSRRHIFRQIDASLRRLGVDHLDMYLIHEPDPSTPLEETLSTLNDLVHAGKARYIGASNMPAWLMTKALWLSDKYHWQRFEWVQNSYSLLDRADERELFPLLADQHLGYTPFSPLAGGWLTGKYLAGQPFPTGSRMTLRPEPYERLLNDATYRGLANLAQHAAQRGSDMASLALAWVMSHPMMTAPIIGPRKPAHLQPAINALDITLTASDRNQIEIVLSAES